MFFHSIVLLSNLHSGYKKINWRKIKTSPVRGFSLFLKQVLKNRISMKNIWTYHCFVQYFLRYVLRLPNMNVRTNCIQTTWFLPFNSKTCLHRRLGRPHLIRFVINCSLLPHKTRWLSLQNHHTIFLSKTERSPCKRFDVRIVNGTIHSQTREFGTSAMLFKHHRIHLKSIQHRNSRSWHISSNRSAWQWNWDVLI